MGVFDAIREHDASELLRLLSKGVDLELQNEYGRTALSQAVVLRFPDLVKIILQHKPNLNVYDEDGNTPLTLAARGDQPPIVSMLLDAGADVNSKNSETGDTPLMNACSGGSLAIVELLIERGADVNASNKHGISAQMRATRTADGKILQRLKNSGARVDEQGA
jgi:ankyrin repeat protein